MQRVGVQGRMTSLELHWPANLANNEFMLARQTIACHTKVDSDIDRAGLQSIQVRISRAQNAYA